MSLALGQEKAPDTFDVPVFQPILRANQAVGCDPVEAGVAARTDE
jgi:hypothetical protein